jgi:uncharacterized membrane protein YcjF (UPF0283 family)
MAAKNSCMTEKDTAENENTEPNTVENDKNSYSTTEKSETAGKHTDEDTADSGRKQGVVQDDAPDSIEELDAPDAEQTGDHETDHDPLAGIESPNRETAPQSRFSSRQVTIGLLVVLVGMAVVFGVPLLLA